MHVTSSRTHRIGALVLWVCLSTALLVGCGDDGGGTDGGGRDSSSGGCDIMECFRPVECVATCGGEVLSSSCCACPAGQLDRLIDCDGDAAVDAGADAAPDTGTPAAP